MANNDMRLRLAIDREFGVEHLVPAMLGVGLGEHHQFGIGRIATERRVAFGQIVDLVAGQGQAEPPVGCFSAATRIAHRVDSVERQRCADIEQLRRVRHSWVRTDSVIGSCRMPVTACHAPNRVAGRDRVQRQCTLDPANGQSAVVAGCRSPCSTTAKSCRHAARPRAPPAAARPTACRIPCSLSAIDRAVRFGGHGIDVAAPNAARSRHDALNIRVEAINSKGGQGRLAVEDDHGSRIARVANDSRRHGPARTRTADATKPRTTDTRRPAVREPQAPGFSCARRAQAGPAADPASDSHRSCCHPGQIRRRAVDPDAIPS